MSARRPTTRWPAASRVPPREARSSFAHYGSPGGCSGRGHTVVTHPEGPRAQRYRTCHEGLTIAHLRSLRHPPAANHGAVAGLSSTNLPGPPYALGSLPGRRRGGCRDGSRTRVVGSRWDRPLAVVRRHGGSRPRRNARLVRRDRGRRGHLLGVLHAILELRYVAGRFSGLALGLGRRFLGVLALLLVGAVVSRLLVGLVGRPAQVAEVVLGYAILCWAIARVVAARRRKVAWA